MNKDEILNTMKDFYGNRSLKFPDKMDIRTEGNLCRITLSAKQINETNMQANCSAFEGWSIAVYAALREKEKNLSVKLQLDTDAAPKKTNGHWNRFLYRVKRFCEQYRWFSCSGNLETIINEAAETFQNSSARYLNNIPENEAGIKKTHNHENAVEAYLAEGGNLRNVIDDTGIFDGECVYRQLPVGLFRNGEVRSSNGVFTGGKSAIDLWSCSSDTFYAIELKTLNKMIGIITEIFFYSNYMYDLLVRRVFSLNPPAGKKYTPDRGYGELFGKSPSIKKIKGIMLADQYHPILEHAAVLDVLNDNGTINICYARADYQLAVKKKGGQKQ